MLNSIKAFFGFGPKLTLQAGLLTEIPTSHPEVQKALADLDKAFDGATYIPELDGVRLGSQLERVKALMSDGQWRKLNDIVAECGGNTASISARLRDLRKEKFGGHVVTSERVGSRTGGYWKYQVILVDGSNRSIV